MLAIAKFRPGLRAVDDHQVNRADPELFDRPVDRGLGGVIVLNLGGELGGDEDVVARDAAAAAAANSNYYYNSGYYAEPGYAYAPAYDSYAFEPAYTYSEPTYAYRDYGYRDYGWRGGVNRRNDSYSIKQRHLDGTE